jgi:phenylalanyl-tRNA synthetase beta chain
MGRLSDAVAEAADIKIPAFIAELDFEWLAEIVPDSIAARELPRFPSADRDIAIVIDDAIPASEIEGEIERAAGGLVRRVWVFDLYKGKNVPSGKKSLAFGIRYRLPDRTLTDEEVNRTQERILESLRARFGAKLRE